MQYALLAYTDGSQAEAGSAGERDNVEGDDALRESGYLLSSVRFPSSSPAVTLRVQQGQVTLSDGPLIETQQQLVALFLINARDLNEAVRVAAKLPQAERGPIEVWAMVDMR
jgi:hypothetical protein